MLKALKDFAWSIAFQVVNFKKGEIFGFDKVREEVVAIMLAKGYIAEVKDGADDSSNDKPLEKMNKAELIAYAKANCGLDLDDKESKATLLAKIEEVKSGAGGVDLADMTEAALISFAKENFEVELGEDLTKEELIEAIEQLTEGK